MIWNNKFNRRYYKNKKNVMKNNYYNKNMIWNNKYN